MRDKLSLCLAWAVAVLLLACPASAEVIVVADAFTYRDGDLNSDCNCPSDPSWQSSWASSWAQSAGDTTVPTVASNEVAFANTTGGAKDQVQRRLITPFFAETLFFSADMSATSAVPNTMIARFALAGYQSSTFNNTAYLGMRGDTGSGVFELGLGTTKITFGTVTVGDTYRMEGKLTFNGDGSETLTAWAYNLDNPAEVFTTSFTSTGDVLAWRNNELYRVDLYTRLGFDGRVVELDNLAVVVPEPGTFALVVGGLLALAAYGWRRRK